MNHLSILAIVALVALGGLVLNSPAFQGAPIYEDPCAEVGVFQGEVIDGINQVLTKEAQGKRCFTTPGFGEKFCCIQG